MPTELDVEALAARYDALEARDASTPAALEALLLEWDELECAVREAYSAAYVDMTGDTTCPDLAARYTAIVERALPVARERGFRLKRRVLESPAVHGLGPEYAVFLRNLRSEVELYREENVPLLTEDLRLAHEFEKVSGGQLVEMRGERRARWAELEERFRPGIDWSGLEAYRGTGWQFFHTFVAPFYTIEYAIAALAALRVWLRSLDDPRGALDACKRALALGGSRPLPELFREAGAELAFDEGTVREVVAATVSRIGSPA